MKTKILMIAMLAMISMSTVAQDADWQHKADYDQILQKKHGDSLLFPVGTTNDEIAGVMLWKAGRNLNTSVGLGITSAIVFSAAAWLPPMLESDPDKQKTIVYVIAGTGGFLAILSIAQFISGASKISKAGIILQHKKFNIKTNGTALLMNF